MRHILILLGWAGIAAIVFTVGFGPAALLTDASIGTAGLGLLGAAVLVQRLRSTGHPTNKAMG